MDIWALQGGVRKEKWNRGPAAFESWLQAPPSKATGPSLQPGVPVHSVAPTSQHAEGSSLKVYPQPPKVQKEFSSPP